MPDPTAEVTTFQTVVAERVLVRRGDGGTAELDGTGLVVTDRHGRARVLVGGAEGEGWRVALLDYGPSRAPDADVHVRIALWLTADGQASLEVCHGDGAPVVRQIGEDPDMAREQLRLAGALTREPTART